MGLWTNVVDNFSKFGAVAAITIVCLLLLLLDVVAGFCLCYHPDREETKPVYERMT